MKHIIIFSTFLMFASIAVLNAGIIEKKLTSGSSVRSSITTVTCPSDPQVVLCGFLQGTYQKNDMRFHILRSSDGGYSWAEFTCQTAPGTDSINYRLTDINMPELYFVNDSVVKISGLASYNHSIEGPDTAFHISICTSVSTDAGLTWRISSVAPEKIFMGRSRPMKSGWTMTKSFEDFHILIDRGVQSDNEFIFASELNGYPVPDHYLALCKSNAYSDSGAKPEVRLSDSGNTSTNCTVTFVDKHGNITALYNASTKSIGLSVNIVKSSDNGKTFTKEKRIWSLTRTKSMSLSSEAFKPYKIPTPVSAVYDSVSDSFFAVWESLDIDSAGTYSLILLFACFDSDGNFIVPPKTISTERNKAHRDCYLPNIALNPAGNLLISYYDCTEDSLNKSAYFKAVISRDKGLSFSNPIRLSSKPSLFGDKSTIGYSLNSRNSILPRPDGFLAFWIDTRILSDLQVYSAFVPDDYSEVADETVCDFKITNLSPQPAGDILTVSINSDKRKNIHVGIADLSGTEYNTAYPIFSLDKGINNLTLNISEFHAGVYILNLTADDGSTVTKRFVINR